MSERPCCSGGWYHKDVPVGHPDFNRLFLCDCPKGQAIRQKRLEKTLGSSLMPLDQQAMTFDNFYVSRGVKLEPPEPWDKSPEAERLRTRWRTVQQVRGGMAGNLRRIKEASQTFAQDPQFFFTLLGEPGCGKTHLAAAIANTCLQRGLTVCFAVVPDLLDALRATFEKKSPVSYEDLVQAYLTVDLLIMDDMGTQYETEWAREKIYQIVNHRYNQRQAMVVTTNNIPAYLDPRLRSRLFDARNHKMEILAGDYRLRRAT